MDSLKALILKEFARFPGRHISEEAFNRALHILPLHSAASDPAIVAAKEAKSNLPNNSSRLHHNTIVQEMIDHVTNAGRMTDEAVPYTLFDTKCTYVSLKNSKVNSSYVVNVVNRCPLLETLILDGCLQVDDTTVQHALTQCKNMRHLSLNNCRKLTNASLEHLYQAIQVEGYAITSLQMGGNFNITTRGLEAFFCTKDDEAIATAAAAAPAKSSNNASTATISTSRHSITISSGGSGNKRARLADGSASSKVERESSSASLASTASGASTSTGSAGAGTNYVRVASKLTELNLSGLPVSPAVIDCIARHGRGVTMLGLSYTSSRVLPESVLLRLVKRFASTLTRLDMAWLGSSTGGSVYYNSALSGSGSSGKLIDMQTVRSAEGSIYATTGAGGGVEGDASADGSGTADGPVSHSVTGVTDLSADFLTSLCSSCPKLKSLDLCGMKCFTIALMQKVIDQRLTQVENNAAVYVPLQFVNMKFLGFSSGALGGPASTSLQADSMISNNPGVHIVI